MAQDIQDQAAPAQRVTFLHVIRNRGFRNLWLGQVISQMGDYFAFLAMMVIVSGFSPEQEDMTLAVSGMMISLTLPRLLFGVLAGVFVDRWDRRRTMIVSDVLRAGLILAMIPVFMAQNLPLMYALAFLMSSLGTLFNPAKSALIPRLVPKEQLLAANSLSQTSQMLATLAGPALAGASFQLAGPGNQWFAFLIDSVSFLVSAVAIWRIVVPAAPPAEEAAPRATSPNPGAAARQVWREMLVGLRAVALNRAIAVTTLVLGVALLGVGAINVLWVVFLRQRFGYDTTELAWRVSIQDIAVGVGMIAASIAVGNYLSHVSPKWLIVFSMIGIGIAIGATGYMPNYWSITVVSLLIGIFNAPINAGVSTLVQLIVPNNQLGRVSGGLGTVIDAAALTSMSMAGVLGATLGIPLVFLLAGALTVLMGLVAWVLIPAVSARSQPEAQGAVAPGETQTLPPAVRDAPAA
jgi:MFS family permease